jgi:lipoprotein-anchoring transpeptidase ErfK/SrfK
MEWRAAVGRVRGMHAWMVGACRAIRIRRVNNFHKLIPQTPFSWKEKGAGRNSLDSSCSPSLPKRGGQGVSSRLTRWSPVWRAKPVIAVLLLAGCLFGPPPPPPPQPVVEVPTPEPEHWVLVRKHERTLSLYAGSQLLKTYPIVLGKDPVLAKLYEGDHRTPEGEYHIRDKYFHPYWSRFMLLDYPTPVNQENYAWSRQNGLVPAEAGKQPGIGGQIGIHGTEHEDLNRRGVNWTQGCISLFNQDIDELYDLLPVGTRVVIK